MIMLKIDGEKFDKLLEKEVFSDEECAMLISQVKQLTGKEDALINSLIVKLFEIAYQRGFKNGMDFIIKREEMELFS
jgi:hypothetical protein